MNLEDIIKMASNFLGTNKKNTSNSNGNQSQNNAHYTNNNSTYEQNQNPNFPPPLRSTKTKIQSQNDYANYSIYPQAMPEQNQNQEYNQTQFSTPPPTPESNTPQNHNSNNIGLQNILGQIFSNPEALNTIKQILPLIQNLGGSKGASTNILSSLFSSSKKESDIKVTKSCEEDLDISKLIKIDDT